MATYYNYAERKATDQIDWSTIAASVTNTLTEEAKIREQKKADIDKASREIASKLENQQLSESDKLNNWWLSFTGDAQQSMLMADNLLKSGKLKPNDYVKLRQNITDGTDQTISLFDEYSKEYADKMKRWNDDVSASFEAWEMENIEGFSNFTDSKLYINPMDFSVSVAKTKKDANGVPNIETFESISTLRNRMKTKYDRYQVIPNLQTGVDALGENIEAVRKVVNKYYGTITNITDITKRKDITEQDKKELSLYQKMESTFIESKLTVPANVASVITDFVRINPENNKPYDFTTDAKLAANDPNLILVRTDDSGKRVFDFTTANGQKQMAVAKNAMQTQFRMMLDKKEEISTYNIPTPAPRTPTQTELEIAFAKEDPVGFERYKRAGKGDGTEETTPVKLQYTEATVGLTEDRLQEKINKFIGRGISDETEAANLDLAVKTMVENLPPDLQATVTSTVVDDDKTPDAYVTIKSNVLPGGYVNVPAATDYGLSREDSQNAQRAIIQKVYDAVQFGKTLSDDDIKNIFPSDLYETYNGSAAAARKAAADAEAAAAEAEAEPAASGEAGVPWKSSTTTKGK